MKQLFAAFAIFATLSAAALCTPSTAQAEDLISLGAGWYDILDNEGAADFRLEYRHGTPLFWELKPWGGAEITSDGSIWGGAGVLLDLSLSDHLYIMPSFGAGLYSQGSSGKDLDYPLEFRSQFEAGYKFDAGQRLVVSFGHISNASLGDDNPGTEILNVYYHIPYGQLFN